MRPRSEKVRPRRLPEDRFADHVAPAAPFRALKNDQFERLKEVVVGEKLKESPDSSMIRRAANEAASLAWVTPYPLLVFPLLFEELHDLGLRRRNCQARVWRQSRELLEV